VGKKYYERTIKFDDEDTYHRLKVASATDKMTISREIDWLLQLRIKYINDQESKMILKGEPTIQQNVKPKRQQYP